MMTVNEIAMILRVGVDLLLIWALLFVCWRGYRVDALRQRIFALRDELFDCAASGAISFEHPAYTMLRVRMNGMIRFAHQITVPRLFLTVAVYRLSPDPDMLKPFEEWRAVLETVPDPVVRQRLDQLHSRIFVVVVGHMLTGSPTLVAALGGFILWSAVHGAARRLLEAFTKRVPGLDLLEAQALES